MDEDIRLAREQLMADDYRTRMHGLVIVGKLRYLQALPQVVNLLHDSDHRVRVEALHVLSHLEDPAVVPEVIDALQDREMPVRGAAVAALRALRDLRAVGPLIARLGDDSAGDVREGALLALAELAGNDPRLRAPLLQALHRDPAYEVRCRAAAQLTAFPDQEVVDALISALIDPDPDVRAAAALALGTIGDRRALPALEHVAASDKGEHWWPDHLETVPVSRTASEMIQRIRAQHPEDDRA